MSTRSTDLTTSVRDGTSQRDRHLPALDPASVAIDERGHADLLAFVQALAEQLRFIADDPDDPTSWAAFASRPDLPIADIVARGYELSAKNPNKVDDYEHRPALDLIQSLKTNTSEFNYHLRNTGFTPSDFKKMW